MAVLNESAAAQVAWPEDLDELERTLLDAIAALPAAARDGAADAPLAPGSSLTAAAARRAVRRPAGQPPPRPHGALAARPRARLLHDRLGRPRGQRARRRRPPPDRSGVAALPLRRLLPRPGAAGAGARRRRRRAARAARLGRRADRRRAPQGLRARRAGGHPADVDDRLAPAAGDGRGVRHRPRRGASACPPAGRRTPSPSPASATPRSTTRRRRGRSTPPCTRPTRACRCRCCSCARTTGWGSACRRRPGGSRRRCAVVPGCATSGPTAPTPSACSTRPRTSPSGCARPRRPAVLHLRTVRFGGHAGTDVESAYRTAAAMRAEQARDPLLATARVLVEHGAATPAEHRRPLPRRAGRRCGPRAMELAERPPLRTAAEVVAPLSPRRPAAVADRVGVAAGADDARGAFFGRLPEDEGPLTLAESINRTLGDLLAADPRVLVFGEDVGAKGGVYGVTRGLQRKAGRRRVFDTLLDEQSILGLALGAGRVRSRADPRDPVPRLPAQRRGPAARRGGQPVVLLQRAVHQPARRAHRRLRLPEGLRRPLPQRQRRRRAARHPRPRDRLPGAPGRRPGDAAHVRRRRRHRRNGERVPRADRPLPHPRSARSG